MTTFSLSTRWNTYRHRSGEAMLEEILELGFTSVELGYDLTLDLVPGVRKLVDQKAVNVSSVHNYCPVPVGAPRGHPELFMLSSPNPAARTGAVTHTSRTIEFAQEVGARVVIAHAGHISMGRMTQKLITLSEQGKQYTPKYERTKARLLLKRERKAGPYLDALSRAVESLLPGAETAGVTLALENVPSWEGIPTESEMESLAGRFDSPALGYWHDIGHGQVRENLGFIGQTQWMERLHRWTKGVHIHDVKPPGHDHLMPPKGNVDFQRFKDLIRSDMVLVFEPAPGTPPDDVREAVAVIRDAWNR
jgi:sugar phosphate isomerase/epimerase